MDASDEIREALLAAQRIEARFGGQIDQPSRSRRFRFLEVRQSAVDLSERDVDDREVHVRDVARRGQGVEFSEPREIDSAFSNDAFASATRPRC